MMECKAALQEANGDLEEADDHPAQARAGHGRQEDRPHRPSEGLIGSYIHLGGKIGVLVELNCESDFVARTDDFQTLLKEIGLQVAAASPQYVRREDVPAEVLDRERGDLPRADGELRQAAPGDRQDHRGQARRASTSRSVSSTSPRFATRRRPSAS